MLARLSAFVIWALVAATAVFWGLRLLVRAPAAPPYAVPVGEASVARADLSRLLGSAPVAAAAAVAAPETSSRFRLLGIVAPTYTATGSAAVSHGVALIAVDGKMPKAYPVGARIDGELTLQSVSLRAVSIASAAKGSPAITLELPPLAQAATGSLPAVPLGGGYVSPVPQPTAVPTFVPPPMQQGGGGAISPQPVLVPPQPRPEAGAPTQ